MNHRTRTKARMQRRMAARRRRILAEDQRVRYLLSIPYVAAYASASTHIRNIRAQKTVDRFQNLKKATAHAAATVSAAGIAIKFLKIQNTPTEVLERL